MSGPPLEPGLETGLAALEGPILVVGAGGMLGRAFLELFAGRVAHIGLGRDRLDLTDPTSVRRAAYARWRTCINCAAYTDVDAAEANEDRAQAVNATGVATLAHICREAGARLIHFSTDYVFDGEAAGPYAPQHPRRPISAYGRSKAMGEEAVEREMAEGLRALVVRTSWLYAPWGRNFVRTIARLSRERPALTVVQDQRGRPTSSEQLARTTVKLAAAGASGIYHATDQGECTWFEFAAAVAERTNPGCSVRPCTTRDYPRPAPRPRNSVLDVAATEAVVGPLRHWRESLDDVLGRMEPDAARG